MDRLEELRQKLEAAKANGWVSTSSLVAIRMTEQTTPDNVPSFRWNKPTYERYEVLDFTFTGGTDRVPICGYKTSLAPWLGQSLRVISYAWALELLAMPLGKSPVHNNP